MPEATVVVVEKKPWYKSKTLWTNITALVGGISAYATTGDPAALAIAGLGLVNFALRLVTKSPVE